MWDEVRRLRDTWGRTLGNPIIVEDENVKEEEGLAVVTKLILLDDD